MILRTVVLAAGFAGALGAAQFPAFSQQYMQRLGGAVQALDGVVADFDASAAVLGLTRQEALDQMRGTEFVEARRADMERTFARHSALSGDLAVLSGMGPFMRAYHARHMMDNEIARGAWARFEPALPVSKAGLFFAVFGFALPVTCTGVITYLFRPRRSRRVLPA